MPNAESIPLILAIALTVIAGPEPKNAHRFKSVGAFVQPETGLFIKRRKLIIADTLMEMKGFLVKANILQLYCPKG